jgi:hypothetical protein
LVHKLADRLAVLRQCLRRLHTIHGNPKPPPPRRPALASSAIKIAGRFTSQTHRPKGLP